MVNHLVNITGIKTMRTIDFATNLILWYICSSVLYTGVGSYMDAKKYLVKYRNNELSQLNLNKLDLNTIQSDWDAVKYGSKIHFWNRFSDSLIWPYRMSANIVPGIVLFFN